MFSISPTLKSAWEVLTLFLVPVGGGIPGGVLLAKTRGFGWPIMMGLYFISDVALACVFEPLMLGLSRVAKTSPRLSRLRDAFKQSTARTVARLGMRPGPFQLIMVSFGIDPMTGRAAALAAGHGFVTGWLIAIAGDMIYFVVLMVSTLWLNNVLKDGTWATIIVMVAMFAGPMLFRKIKEKFRPAPPAGPER